MRSKMWALAALICLFWGNAAAQQPENDKTLLTVTGCLQPDTLNTLNTPIESGYKLTDVTKKPGGEKAYVLDGFDADLKTHVGHEVEVTGVLSVKRDAVTPPEVRKASPTVTAGGTKTVDNGMPRLRVNTVRMISTKCPSKE